MESRLLFLLVSFCASLPLTAGSPAVRSARGRLPLRFEPAADGRLVAREGPYTLTASPGRTEVTIADRARAQSATVATTLAGAARASRPVGADPLPGQANYLLGADPAAWRTGQPLFARALYRGVYPGIDLVFHGETGAIEYDFVLRPGADPRAIALDVSGASSLHLEPGGALSLATAAGEIRWRKPEIYQWKDGVRQPIPGAFALHGRRVTFAVGRYDRSRELVIDPTLAYATYFGGADSEGLRGLAVDASGNFYVTGFTYSMNVPHTAGSLQPSYHGGAAHTAVGGDAFVAKYTAAGALAWVTYLGGSGDDAGGSLAVDSSGNVYVTGFTASVDFPTVAGSFQTRFGGAGGNSGYFQAFGDAFVAKLNPTGSALVYSTYLGGSNDDEGTAIAVDSAGNAYVGGTTLSTNFPTMNPYQAAWAGAGGGPDFFGPGTFFVRFGDGFLTKLNPAGTALVFSTYFGGELDDTVSSLALDASGNVYLAGSTLSTRFPTLNAYQSRYGGAASAAAQPVVAIGDGYVAKFSSTGGLLYSTYLGGSGDDAVLALAVDAAGAAYVTGFTSSSNFPVSANAAQKTFAGPPAVIGSQGFVWGDAFVAKLAPSGGSLAWSTYLGGSQNDAGMAIALDSGGNAIVGGFANSTNLPVTSDAQQKTFGGNGPSGYADPTGDAFLAKLGADGSSFQYLSYYGGNASDAISTLAIDGLGNVIAGGATTSTNLPITASAAQAAFGGLNASGESAATGDAFVAVFSGVASAPSGPTIGSVINGATFLPGFTPGSWVAIKGANLAGSTRIWTGADFDGLNLPTALDNVSVTINGKPAYVYYVSPTQINVLAPAEAAAGSMPVQVTYAGAKSNVFSAAESAFAPGLFVFFPQGAKYVAAVRLDGQYLGPTDLYPGLTVPAKAGDFILLFGTGFGPTNPATNFAQTFSGAPPTVNTVTATIGGVPASVLFAGLVVPGEYQFNLVVPSVPSGDNLVTLTVNGFSTQTGAYLRVQ